MNVKFPERITADEYKELNEFLQHDRRSVVPEIRTAIEVIRENFTTFDGEFSQKIQDAFESVFGSEELSLGDKAAFCRELHQDYHIFFSTKTYPYYAEVVKQFGPILLRARKVG